MRFFAFAPLALLVVFGVPVANAQGCANSWNSMQINCSGGGCSQSVIIYYPNSSEDGVPVLRTTVSCCGYAWGTSYPGQGGCHSVELDDPKFRKQLDVFAQTTGVLVADCAGKYELYRAQAEPAPKTAFINEHILR